MRNLDWEDVHCFVALGGNAAATARALRVKRATVATVLQAGRPSWGGFVRSPQPRRCSSATSHRLAQASHNTHQECRLDFPVNCRRSFATRTRVDLANSVSAYGLVNPEVLRNYIEIRFPGKCLNE